MLIALPFLKIPFIAQKQTKTLLGKKEIMAALIED